MNSFLRTSVMLVVFAFLALPTWAHVVVRPSQVGVASWTVFTVSVPNEKEVATTQIKLVLPEGLQNVTPNVKPGWKVTLEKDAKGVATAIVWSAGSLGVGFRDEFGFQAQVPAQPTALNWKAYQTYQGNVVVSWDLDPSDPASKDMEALEKTGKGPYSVTKVVDDLTAPATTPPASSVKAPTDSPTALIALGLAVVALVVALVALVRRRKA